MSRSSNLGNHPVITGVLRQHCKLPTLLYGTQLEPPKKDTLGGKPYSTLTISQREELSCPHIPGTWVE